MSLQMLQKLVHLAAAPQTKERFLRENPELAVQLQARVLEAVGLIGDDESLDGDAEPEVAVEAEAAEAVEEPAEEEG